ncbi:autotransporter assembly complex protein TamA [Chitinibacter sp. S2-10]|uniref:autotransporter assembly complex protein TamA n=1 Tax=Chitinibacter sp. S2-10 TaxID=3373597 RepID=UPI0039778CE6
MRTLTLIALFAITGTALAADEAVQTETPSVDLPQNEQGEPTKNSPFHYQIRLEAPSEARSLLEKHLNIFKWQQRLSPELLQRELDAIPDIASELLATEGYFDAKVTTRYDSEKSIGYVDVELGEPTLVSNTSVQLQGAITENQQYFTTLSERLNRRGEALEDEKFSQSAWDDFKKRSLQSVQARHYPAAKLVFSEALIDPVSKTAQFNLVIDSGPAYVFGAYTLNGLSRYPAKIVTDRVKIAEGAPYQRSALVDLQTELQNMPHFGSALVDVELTELAPDGNAIAPIRIDVQEVPLQRLNAGLGFSTNTGVKSELAYRYLDLFERGWIFDSRLRLEQLEQALELGVTFPRTQHDWEHRVWASYLHQDLEGVDSSLYKTGISRLYKTDDDERSFDLQYQMEQRSYQDGTEEFPESLTLNHIWKIRQLDNRNNPRNGYMSQFEVGGALGQFFSDASFLRVFGRGAYYARIGRQGQFVGQASLGQTFSEHPEGITSDWLFRAGGSGSVRGYDYQSLGIQSNGSTLGGQVTATASLEYQHPLVKDWRGAVFVDHGGAGADWNTLNAVTGVGVGARWNSPVGQVGIDLAYGVDYEQFRVHFAMGLVF